MKIDVYGESTSLKKKSRTEDEAIILKALHRHYN